MFVLPNLMAKQKTYWTGMITQGAEPDQPSPPFKGAGWVADTAPQRRDPVRVYRGSEIVLRASSWISAQRALNLIQGCHQLLEGDPPVFPVQAIAHNEKEPDWMPDTKRAEQAEWYWSTSDIPLACAIAAKASRRLRWVYAVAKYTFSLSIYSVHHMDLEPWMAPHLPLSRFPGDHVMFCHAIISAYSVVEDLKLSVIASAEKPSRIKGEWNPEVRNDLESRLAKAGVDLGETLLWTARGPRRRIEKRRPIPDGLKAPWSAWVVRDSEIQVIDAIAYAQWLRSAIASHGVKELTPVLSPYDVINVQHLARRLLLENLGFWRWHEREIARIKKQRT